MLAHEIKALLRTQPFQGARIHISDGETYEVMHPDMVYVTSTIVQIALPPLDAHGIPTGGSVYCDPIHITRIEPLHNGKHGKPKGRKKPPRAA
ncbi:MAG: hypothetical protein HY287_00130 [Planctomycetes bacterium]|nr:hypothetical protein [Planctomycetota bacterium]MBI3832719.1 hypothetical protein [Planctomycetota bacterium]